MNFMNQILRRRNQTYSFRCFSKSCITLNQPSKKRKHLLWEWKIPGGHDTNIKIKNSYYCLGSRKSWQHVPLIIKDPKCITWYSCGPTVYSSSHVGHAVSYIRMDAIRRILANYFGYKINMVIGITDVDDKIISRSNLLGEEFLSLARKYELEFKEDLHLLNILPPMMYMRVSDILPQIMSFIDRLLQDGHAYQSGNGNVWFDVDKFTSEGYLNPIQEEYVTESANEIDTVIPKQEKKGPRDFALWKKAKPGEPYWETPWGGGRPGWHVECSTISSLVFGNHIDIHSGGCDLRFPHHECEILQSQAYHGRETWVNYFLHTGKLSGRGSERSKMSKSLGNSVSIRDFLSDLTCDHLRYISLSTNWFLDVEYSDDIVDDSKDYIQTMQEILVKCQRYIQGNLTGEVCFVAVEQLLTKCKTKIDCSYRDNFDTAEVLSELMNLAQSVSKMFKYEINEYDSSHDAIQDTSPITEVLTYLTESFELLGFKNMSPTAVTVDTISKPSTVVNDSSSFTSDFETLLHDYAKFRVVVKDLANELDNVGVVNNKELKKKLYKLTDIPRNDFKKRNLVLVDAQNTPEKYIITELVEKKKKRKNKNKK